MPMLQDELQRLASRHQTIRQSVPDEAAIHHAAGQAVFVDDIPDLAGTLHIAIGHASIAAGQVTKLELGAVEAARDVVFALTANDIRGANDASPERTQDHPIIGTSDVEFYGQALFAVVARSRKAAKDAVGLARLSTATALPTIDLDDALATNATLLGDYGLLRGEPDEEIKRCDRKLMGQLRTGSQDHFFLEPHTTLAVPTEGGGLQIITSAEDPALIQQVVAEMLDLSANAVTVETRRVGGAFGGKRSGAVQWAAIAALAAWRSGRPCKLRLGHADGLAASGKRQSLKIDYTAGITDTGLINAVTVSFAARSGSGVDFSVETNDRIVLSADNAYYYPALSILSRRMRSNTPPGTTIRGAGVAEGTLFAERLMDHIAVSLGRDPLDIRKTNLYAAGRDRTPYSMTVEDNILAPLVNELERTSEYRRRRRDITRFNQTSPILKKGLALVPVKAGIRSSSMLGRQAAAMLQIQRDGTMSLALSAVEEGRGVNTRAAQIVAEEFGIRHQEVRVSYSSTAFTDSVRAATLDTVLMAVIDACRTIKDRLYDFFEETMHVERERVEFREGRIRLGVRGMDFAEIMTLASDANVSLAAIGSYSVHDIDWDRVRAVGRPFHYFAFGAACAEVTVDVMTGEKRIDRVDILQDAGRSLNPALDLGLIEGGFALGLGWLTSEQLSRDSTGRLTTNGAAGYAVPTAADIPSDFRVAFYHTAGAKEETPYRSKDIEDAAVPLAISVFSAITDAVASLKPGTMPRLNAPATPEATMRAVRALGNGE
jgi:xanthine dehydrogenase large subunit